MKENSEGLAVNSNGDALESSLGAESIADMMRKVLGQLGEDPEREGLRGTPVRYERLCAFLPAAMSRTLRSC